MPDFQFRSFDFDRDWSRVSDIMRRSFGGDPEDQRRWITAEVTRDATQVFEVDGQIVGLTSSFDCHLQTRTHGAIQAKFGSGLMIDPAHRGTGLARAVIEGLYETWISEGARAVLIEGAAPQLYQAVGFQTVGYVPQWQARLANIDRRLLDQGKGCTVKTIPQAEAPATLAKLESQIGGFQPGRIVRSEAMWWFTVEGTGKPTDSFVIKDPSGQPIGHFTLNMAKDGGVEREGRILTVRNWWAATPQAYAALLGHLKGHQSWFDGFTWVGGLPCPLADLLDDWPKNVALRPLMARSLDPDLSLDGEFEGGWFNELCP